MTNQATMDTPSTGFEVGQGLPDIVLPALEDGRPLPVANFQGQKTILHIFASW
jgi:hypothetical protein